MSLLRFHSHSEVDPEYWRELGIAVDSINDFSQKELAVNDRMETLLNRLTVENLKELAELYQIELEKDMTKEKLVSKFKILEKSSKIELFLLQDFLNRKKRAVDDIYSIKCNDNRNLISSLARVKFLYQSSPKLLMEAFTYFQWNEKGSGIVHTFSKKVPYKNILKLTTDYKTSFPQKLFEKSKGKNYFKIHSYFTLDNKELILNVYKQVNDSPRPDFDKAIRNKEVSSILLRVDIEQNLVEFKGANKTDEGHIISYIEETYSVNSSEVKPSVFKDYNPEAITNAFLTGESVSKDKVMDFLVTKISFRGSLLKRSPKISIELDNESIWPSIIDAQQKGILTMRSIKDIEHVMAQIKNKKRLIRSNILQNGNVIFSFDDSRMDNDMKENFKDNFQDLFGIPLFQEISNYGFFEGRVDKFDYLMSLSNPDILSNEDKSVFDRLVLENLIKEKQGLILTCKSCKDVSEIEDVSFNIESFICECGHTECYYKKTLNIEINLRTVTDVIKKQFNSLFKSLGYTDKPKLSTININEEKHKFISYHNDETNEMIQLFITSDYIRPTFIKRLSTMMIPTLIITVGMVEETIQSLRDQGVHPINFGKIYLSDQEELKEYYLDNIERVKRQSKTKIAEAADHAYISLKQILKDPSKVDSKYTDKIFEDDVFALLKDIIPNGEKWGKEKSGKAYPEGIFAISAKNVRKGDFRRVFSYDCKFTRDDNGYDLKREEKRKAIEYVEKLNENDYVINYSDKKELTAHIFISNRFQEQQKVGMRDFFNSALGEDYDTKPIFLDVECLLYMHESYRNNVEHILANRNLFYEQLILLFTRENISKQEIDKIFMKALDKDLEENRKLDTKKVTNTYKDY
ncbi:hypothetical protein [Neobacillus terrae]|uniref:hypothetical protein n=1 Tax=Neobacillus terrae TaxID=3034837 RepID=UPI001408390B|nr:hypothetical protein [Neobacillus terrae]NHM31287.1 hypothetical protein [Neobacillus terrae]